jgi:outer membrane protein assembly factor BamB
VINSVTAGGSRIVVAGAFSERATMGERAVTAAAGTSRRPQQDGFVAALSPDGRFLWVRSLGGSSAETAQAAVVTRAGSIIVAGSFGGLLELDKHVLAGRGQTDVFVAALDDQGGVQWAKNLGGPGRDLAHGLALVSGDVVVAGTFEDRFLAASYELTGAGAHDVFAVKLTATGAIVGARRLGGPGHESTAGVAASGQGGFVVIGSLTAAAELGGRVVLPAGEVSAFVTRFGP